MRLFVLVEVQYSWVRGEQSGESKGESVGDDKHEVSGRGGAVGGGGTLTVC